MDSHSQSLWYRPRSGAALPPARPSSVARSLQKLPTFWQESGVSERSPHRLQPREVPSATTQKRASCRGAVTAGNEVIVSYYCTMSMEQPSLEPARKRVSEEKLVRPRPDEPWLGCDSRRARLSGHLLASADIKFPLTPLSGVVELFTVRFGVRSSPRFGLVPCIDRQRCVQPQSLHQAFGFGCNGRCLWQ